MDFSSPQFWVSVLQIVWIDLLLSGDNAVVIALACRSLPESQKKMGIWLGAGAAVLLRILFALVVTYLMGLPFLKVVGGLLLFWIAVKLVVGEDDAVHAEIDSADNLWKAVKTIAIADAVMSLDNVIAISAASKGHSELFIFGLLLSIPLIIYGAQFIMGVIERYPILVWFGAALLGWIAGEMLVSDNVILGWFQTVMPSWVMPVATTVNPSGMAPSAIPHYGAAALGAAFVVAMGLILNKRRTQP